MRPLGVKKAKKKKKKKKKLPEKLNDFVVFAFISSSVNNKVTSSIRDTISMETESILKRYQMWSVLKTAHFLGFSCRVNGETASL